MRVKEFIQDNFWAKVNKTKGCWIWLGYKQYGYGIWNNEVSKKLFRTRKAHRVAFQINGAMIPEKMVIDHKCKNKCCVRPSHLRVTTRGQNSVENSLSPAALNKLKTKCNRGHKFTKINTLLIKLRTGTSARQCRICLRARTKAYKNNQTIDEVLGL